MNGSTKEASLTDGIALDKNVIKPITNGLQNNPFADGSQQQSAAQLNGGGINSKQAVQQQQVPFTGSTNGAQRQPIASNHISMASQQQHKRPFSPQKPVPQQLQVPSSVVNQRQSPVAQQQVPQVQQRQSPTAQQQSPQVPQFSQQQRQSPVVQQQTPLVPQQQRQSPVVQQRQPPAVQQRQQAPINAQQQAPVAQQRKVPQQGSAPTTSSKQGASAESGSIPSKPEKIVKRRLRRVEHKPKPYDKYAWLAGHCITIVGFLIYSGYYITFKSHKSFFAHFVYRFALFGVVIAYFVSMLNQFGLTPPSYFTLLTTENFQYLCLAIVWFFNRSSIFKILPYFLISILHLSLFYNIKPVLKLEKSVKKVIIYNELFLFVLLTFDTILLRGTSGYALVVFSMFYSLKLVFSEETKSVVYSVLMKFDGVISKQKNPKIQALWHDVKSFLLKKNKSANTYNFQVKK